MRRLFYAPSIDYYVITRFARHRGGLPAPAGLLGRGGAAAARRARARGARDPARGRPQAAAVDGQPRPAGAHAAADARRRGRSRRGASRRCEPRIQATVDELLGAVDAAEPFDLVRALTFPLPATIVFSLHGRARARLAAAEAVVRLAREPRLGAAGARGAGRARDATWPPTAATCASWWPRRRDDRADDFASALLEIHDEDPDALSHEEIASILFSLSLRRPRDDELPDREPDPAAARGPHALGGACATTRR